MKNKKKHNINYLIIWIIFVIFFQGNIVMARGTITINLDFDNDTLQYKVQNKQFSLHQLYDYLAGRISKKDRHIPVYVIFNQNIKFKEVVNLKGILHKIGYSNIKYFYYGEDKRRMAEINMDKAGMPYTEVFNE